MVSLKFVLRTPKKRSNGTIPVYLRITQNRKSRFLSTKVLIEEKYWNASKERVRSSHPQYHVLNDTLDQILLNAKLKINEFGIDQQPSPIQLKRALAGKDSPSFIDYTRSLIKTFSHWHEKRYKSLLNKLRGCSS